MAITEAICLTHRIDIADGSRKYFLLGFIESVKSLARFADQTDEMKTREFERFITEFGTHYSTTSKLGTKLVLERRYTSRERAGADKNEIAECNSQIGAKVFGLTTESSRNTCRRTELLRNQINSTVAERMVVSTYGSFIADSLASWSQQVVELVESGKFTGRVIREQDTFPNDNHHDE